MALAHGYALPFEAIRRTGVLSQNAADAAVRASNDAGSKEAAGSCLDGRALDLQQRTIVQPSILIVPQLTRNGVVYNQIPNTRTNYIQNNVMAGATGSVIPNLWSAVAPPSGITVSYSASGQTTAADGATVNYIDVTVSGTALASGNFNLRQLPSPSPVSGNMLFTSGAVFTASIYLALVSGAVSGISPNYQLQEVSGTTFVTGSSLDLSTLTSSLTRYNLTRTLNGGGGADRVQVRWGHAIASGQTLDYTIRIASPQLQKRSAPMPIINTTSGFVTVDANGVARDGAPPDFTFTRATTATRVNASGLIESVASGLLRLDYPVTGGCPAGLIEASGTNLALRSEEFDNASWSKTDITVTTGSTSAFTAPDGTTNADLFTSTASGSSFLAQTITIASGAATFSVFAKAGNHGIFRIGNVSSAARAAWFDLNAGAVIGTVNGGTASIQNYGSGWYRCIFTASSVVSGGSTFIIAISDAANGTASVSGATMYAWGAQLETGAIPTSYIPTTTGSATRAADVCSVSGVSGYIGQTEGTIYAEFRYLGFPPTGSRAGFVYLRQANLRGLSISLAPSDSPSGIVFASRNNAGTTQIRLTSGLTLGAYYKIAIAYDAGGTAAGGTQTSGVTAYVNGSPAVESVASFRVPDSTISEIRLHGANSGSDTESPNGNLRAAAIYTTRLSNDQLANLTRLT